MGSQERIGRRRGGFRTGLLLALALPLGGTARAGGDVRGALCLIEHDRVNGRSYTCSGSLIGSRTVVTAAHCLPKDRQQISGTVRVSCGILRQSAGGGGQAFSDVFGVVGVRFSSEGAEVPRGRMGLDFAFLRLNRAAVNAQPISLPGTQRELALELMTASETAESDYELRTDVECRLAGFGPNPKRRVPEFRSTDLRPREGLRAFMSRDFARADSLWISHWGGTAPPVRPGDSGGAFACRRLDGGDWRLLGIISSSVGPGDVSASEWKNLVVAATVSGDFASVWRELRAEWESDAAPRRLASP